MASVAALLMVIGTGIRTEDPKGMWANCTWLASVFMATFMVLAVKYNWDHLWTATKISAAVLSVLITIGFVRLFRKTNRPSR